MAKKVSKLNTQQIDDCQQLKEKIKQLKRKLDNAQDNQKLSVELKEIQSQYNKICAAKKIG